MPNQTDERVQSFSETGIQKHVIRSLGEDTYDRALHFLFALIFCERQARSNCDGGTYHSKRDPVLPVTHCLLK